MRHLVQQIAEMEMGRQWAADKGQRYCGPLCRCGSRNTARVGSSALIRQCQACGQTYAYRLRDGLLVPFTLTTALAMEGK